jgi:low affinity Fe/Cu permease
LAVQLKLNELIAATKGASNRLVDIEDLSESELEAIKKFYIQLADLAEKDLNLKATHSYDDARENHEDKLKVTKPHVKK